MWPPGINMTNEKRRSIPLSGCLLTLFYQSALTSACGVLLGSYTVWVRSPLDNVAGGSCFRRIPHSSTWNRRERTILRNHGNVCIAGRIHRVVLTHNIRIIYVYRHWITNDFRFDLEPLEIWFENSHISHCMGNQGNCSSQVFVYLWSRPIMQYCRHGIMP